jgi:hypothetical protein
MFMGLIFNGLKFACLTIIILEVFVSTPENLRSSAIFAVR